MTKKTKAPFRAEGGGGCFPAGTKVNTPTGYKNIEDIVIGDVVYAFDLRSLEPGEVDLPGRIFEKKVVNTFTHTFGEVGYTSPLLVIEHTKGVLNVTGNHYILTPSRVSAHTEADANFVRADELCIGDFLYSEYGDKLEITNIQPGIEYDFVYNLEVEDLHTYIASAVRVHNGGGGKGAKTPVQAPNSVRSKQVARVLLCPSEGESGGLYNTANPGQSVYFDGTPIQNADGTYNFSNITVEQRVGLPSQDVIAGFSATESEYLTGLTITNVTPQIRTITSANIDAVRVTIEFPVGLQNIDTKTGNADGTAVSFAISTRLSAGTWVSALTPTVSEMSSGPFQVAYLIKRPAAAGTWEFKVERLTADSSSNNLINATSLKSYTEIRNVALPYNDRALVALTVGADSTNGRIPNIGLDWVGVKVKVPNNYNAATRIYTGSWTGAWSGTYVTTNNPVWCLYDMLTNDRYGIGGKLDESLLDKFSFYEAAVYCDQLVSDGKGLGTFEPRFTFDAQFMVRENAWKALQAVASTFNAQMYMHGGIIRIAQDRPTAASRLITNSMVAGGMFTYSSSAASQRLTACNITYNNPLDNGLPTLITEVGSPAQIARFGYQSQDLVAYGASTEGQARRAAKWAVLTSLDTTNFVEFNVDAANADFEPYEVFKLMDSGYAQVTQEGRIAGISGTTITLDRPLNKTVSGSWDIEVYAADGSTIETRTITSGISNSNTITINSGISSVIGSAYIVTGAVSPRQFRCISMNEVSVGVYSVKAVQYDPNKWSAMESGVTVPSPVYFAKPDMASIKAPTDMVFAPQSTTNPEGVILRYLSVNWTPPVDNKAARYIISYRKDKQPMTELSSVVPYVKIEATVSGVYEVYVKAVNSAGVTSPLLSGTYAFNMEADVGSLILPVGSLTVVGGGTSFTGEDLNVQFTHTLANNAVSAVLKDFEVRVYNISNVLLRTTWVPAVDPGAVQKFAYTYAMNTADGGPNRSVRIDILCRDTMNKLSTATSITATNPAPAVLNNLSILGGLGSVKITFDRPADSDYMGILVWRDTGSSFTPSAANLVYEGDATYISRDATAGTSFYYKAAAYDTFGKSYSGTGLNVSGSILAIAGSGEQGVPSGPTLPATGTEGESFFNTTNGRLYFYRSGVWVAQGIQTGNTTQMNALTGMVVGDLWSNTTDGKLYRYNGTIWTAAVPSADITGQLVTAQIADAAIAVAKLADNAVTTAKLSDSAVTALKLVDGAITAVKIADSSITAIKTSIAAINAATGNLNAGTVNAAQLVTDSVTSVKIAANAVTAAKTSIAAIDAATGNLNAGTVNASQLVTDAVTSVKIAASAVTAAKTSLAAINSSTGNLNANTVTATNIVSGSITALQIASDTITASQIAAGAIGASEIAAGAITAGKIAAGAIVAADIAADTIVAGNIAAGAIGASEIATGAITAGKIAAGTIVAADIAASTITGAKIAAGTITASNIVSNTITSLEINATSIRSAVLTANAIGAGMISAGTITATEIAGLTITGAKIAAGTISADKIVANSITSSQINAGSIQTAVLTANSITTGMIAASQITGAKIAATTITAANIVGNTITGDKFQAGSVTADKLSVSSLSAVSATIGTLRTATTGGRTEIADNVIRVFDASNVLRVRIGYLL